MVFSPKWSKCVGGGWGGGGSIGEKSMFYDILPSAAFSNWHGSLCEDHFATDVPTSKIWDAQPYSDISAQNRQCRALPNEACSVAHSELLFKIAWETICIRKLNLRTYESYFLSDQLAFSTPFSGFGRSNLACPVTFTCITVRVIHVITRSGLAYVIICSPKSPE